MAALDKTVQFRASAEEKEHLVKAADDADMKLSPYLRSVVLARTVVVVGGEAGVVVIPATDTSTARDREIMAAVQAAIEQLNAAAAPSPPASDVIAVAPAGSAPGGQAQAPPAPTAPPEASVPASSGGAPAAPGPATSPGEGEQMVGAGSHEPPPPSPPSSGGGAGSIPGPGETESVEPLGAGACPHCGGVDGQHQSFCEEIRGEPPVTGTEEVVTPPAPEGRPIESREQFIERRVGEGENQIVAEAEWRQMLSGQAPAASMVACPVCGTKKSAAVDCPDCGTPPQ